GGPDGDMRWGLNSEDSSLTGNTVSMDTYIQATEQYIQHVADNDYDTKVFFTTGPVDGGGNSGERGYQRYLKHEHIRNWVSNNNRYLFDYADILNHNDAGEENIISWDGHDFPRIHPDNMMDFDESWNLISHTEDGDHIGEAGAVRIAKAMWWILARMAGWDGSITPDNDGDGILNDGDESGSSSDNYCTGGETENCDDNCMNTANPDQADSDGDGRGDACDSCPNDPEKTSPGICGCGVSDIDSDGDGYPDCNDNCPSYHNSDQADHDSDGMGDVCDPDDDDDGDPDTTDCAPLDENRYTGAPEICDGTDNNCNGEIDEEACPSCTDEEITSRCDCGGSSYDSGYCCEGVYSSSECANSCNEGEINSECDCGGFSYNPGSGYCCSGNYQPINCSYSYYQDKFSDTTGIASSSEGIELHSSRISFRSGTDIDSDPDLVSIYLFEDPSNLGVDTKENNDMGIENGGFTNGNPEQSLVVPNSCSGYSLRLDGDDSICAAHSSSFDASSSHTLCWWVNPQSSSSGNNFAHASRYDTWDGDTPDVYRWSTNFDGWNRLDISNVFSQDKWVHICNVYDKNAGSKTVYINSTSSGSSSVSGMPGTSGEWCIGSYCFSDGNCGGYLNGYIYQPMWFNRSLDETEIEEIYLNTYFGAGNPQGQFTSNIIIAENNITKIELIEWTEENTDQNNNITVEISVDGGNSWMIAENHGSLNGLEKGRELVYRVSFNSPENTLYFDDINITWIESGEDACHYADSDSDGQISTIEMNTHIYNWKTNNNITLADLILVIKLWLQNL
ncbi:MAG: LamG-like jellyroll fold domain-containing protein, partial [Candidatus Woesearchaeota archaeon]